MDFAVASTALDEEQTLAAAMRLDDPAATVRDPLRALLQRDCVVAPSTLHEVFESRWRCGALVAVRVLAAAGSRSPLWRRYHSELREEVVLPAVLTDRIASLSSCAQDQFRAGNDREALRCGRALGAILERVSPPELIGAPPDEAGSNASREVRAALLWARAALSRLQNPSSLTTAVDSETTEQRVARLVSAAMECTTPGRPPWGDRCPPLDELAAMGEESVAPLIDAIERDERTLRIGAWTAQGDRRYLFVPAPVRAALFPIVEAQLRVQTPAHALFDSRAPGPSIAAALRVAWNAQSRRSAARLDADDWGSTTTACAALDEIARRWLVVARRPWNATPLPAPILASSLVCAAVVAHTAAVARRCDGVVRPLALLGLVELARAPHLAAAVFDATSTKSDELFEATMYVLSRSEDPRVRVVFALNNFASGDRSLGALAARLDVLGPLADQPEITAMLRRVLREHHRDSGEPLLALLEATRQFPLTRLARELFAPSLATCDPVGELVIDDERKALVIIGPSSTPVAALASATPGRTVWRSCDAAALRLCSEPTALVDVVERRAPTLQRCMARGPRGSEVLGAARARDWLSLRVRE